MMGEAGQYAEATSWETEATSRMSHSGDRWRRLKVRIYAETNVRATAGLAALTTGIGLVGVRLRRR